MPTDTYMKEYQKQYNTTPKGSYIRQRSNARRRGIMWEFTFETWWKKWEDSGKWDQRGKRADQYCMSRLLDSGPYSPTNTKIITNSKNSRDACKLTGFGTGIWTKN